MTERLEDIAEAIDPSVLADRLGRMVTDPSKLMAEKGPWKVLLFKAEEAPEVLEELGRLRELTFRNVGEGTGRSRDNDEFDSYYHHLVVWHQEKRQIAGAYRIGFTAEILEHKGLTGMYSHGFFRYEEDFFDLPALRQSVELGRSFVVPEHQGRSPVLILLFRGLAKILFTHQSLRGFFGTVSISDEYSEASKQLMTRYMMSSFPDDHQLIEKMCPVEPYDLSGEPSNEVQEALTSIESTKGLDERVKEMDGVGAPPLLHIYSTMGAQYIGFNRDLDFNSLDGLIYVDIERIPDPILDQYYKDSKEEFKKSKGLK